MKVAKSNLTTRDDLDLTTRVEMVLAILINHHMDCSPGSINHVVMLCALAIVNDTIGKHSMA